MAIAVASYAAVFKRTANLPNAASCSLWGWFRRTADRNTFSGCLALVNAVDGSSYRAITFDSDGTTLALTSHGMSTTGFGTQPAANEWFFAALTCSGNGNNLNGYVRRLTDNTLSSLTGQAAGTSFTSGAMEFGGGGFTAEFLSGEIHALGACDSVLSADELLELSYFHEPQLDGIRSLNVFYPCIESVNSNATVDRSGNGRNATATVGSLADSPSLLWRAPGPIVVIPAVAAGDVTLALTGQALTSSLGVLSPSTSIALSGGQVAVSSGVLLPGHAVTLSGAALAAAAGVLGPSLALALTGMVITIGQGTVSAPGNVTVALTGQLLTTALGSVGVNVSTALSGQAATAVAGVLLADLARGLSGASMASSSGSLAPALSVSLTGSLASFGQGSLTPPISGDPTPPAIRRVTVTVNTSINVNGASEAITVRAPGSVTVH
jgi:hypothetical protein